MSKETKTRIILGILSCILAIILVKVCGKFEDPSISSTIVGFFYGVSMERIFRND